MKDELSHLVHQLKGKSHPRDLNVEFIRYGEKGFCALLDLFESSCESENQMSNALMVMFDMVCKGMPDRSSDLFRLAVSLLCDSRVGVRTAAAKVTVGMLSLLDGNPNFFDLGDVSKNILALKLKQALDLKVSKQSEPYIAGYLKKLGHD
ncbi:hypothetical protein [Teredinibacter haidensis]|uniref:hypothetical protein n=1 Tax=Teredinibacter haidensis TaxID=2731755 RepID=UPI000948B0B0|nr:hypothetical protein [Teredinibacter haidensis]